MIGVYPTVSRLSRHEEDGKLNFVYRSRKTFGIGHGCAVTWEPGSTEFVKELVANPMPRLEVKGLTNDIEIPDSAKLGLNLRWLYDSSRTQGDYREKFTVLLEAYRKWVSGQKLEASKLDANQIRIAANIIHSQEMAVGRMEKGIECLCSEGNVRHFKAFRLEQLAMLTHFLLSWQAGKGPYEYGESPNEWIDPFAIGVEESPKWRQFQLAFQLLQLNLLRMRIRLNAKSLICFGFRLAVEKRKRILH